MMEHIFRPGRKINATMRHCWDINFIEGKVIINSRQMIVLLMLLLVIEQVSGSLYGFTRSSSDDSIRVVSVDACNRYKYNCDGVQCFDSIAGCLSQIVTINFVFLWSLSSVNEKQAGNSRQRSHPLTKRKMNSSQIDIIKFWSSFFLREISFL